MNKTRPHSKDLRMGRVSIQGQVYLVTTTTLDRVPFFADFRFGRILVNTMRYYEENGNVESLAFVIMPDHLHWLFSLTGTNPLSKLIGQVKGATAHGINHAWMDRIAAEAAPASTTTCGSAFTRDLPSIAAEAAPTGRLGRIWEKGFHDRALRRDEDFRAIARYMVMNPVRAGIVSRIWDYPLWDAVWVDNPEFDIT